MEKTDMILGKSDDEEEVRPRKKPSIHQKKRQSSAEPPRDTILDPKKAIFGRGEHFVIKCGRKHIDSDAEGTAQESD
jgi:hypothetical protein